MLQSAGYLRDLTAGCDPGRLTEEVGRFDWTRDQFNDLIRDMLVNKGIEYDVIITALRLVTAELLANVVVGSKATKPPEL